MSSHKPPMNYKSELAWLTSGRGEEGSKKKTPNADRYLTSIAKFYDRLEVDIWWPVCVSACANSKALLP